MRFCWPSLLSPLQKKNHTISKQFYPQKRGCSAEVVEAVAALIVSPCWIGAKMYTDSAKLMMGFPLFLMAFRNGLLPFARLELDPCFYDKLLLF